MDAETRRVETEDNARNIIKVYLLRLESNLRNSSLFLRKTTERAQQIGQKVHGYESNCHL